MSTRSMPLRMMAVTTPCLEQAGGERGRERERERERGREREREGERGREREPTKHKHLLRERGGAFSLPEVGKSTRSMPLRMMAVITPDLVSGLGFGV